MKTANPLTEKVKIVEALKAFDSGSLASNAIHLFDTLGYRSSKSLQLEPNTTAGLLELANRADFLNPAKAHADEWQSVDFLFQLTDEEIRNLAQGSLDFDSKADVHSNKLIESYIFFAVELRGDSYPRTVLADITREINRLFPMPALVLFKHDNALTLSIINRRIHKRDAARDVLEKVTLIKDIRIQEPHRGQVEILFDLAFPQLIAKHEITNFVQLEEAWRKTLDTSELNKRFYKDLANWYFWTLQHVEFPKQDGVADDINRATNVIRLITRLIFVWFLKERELVPDALFDPKELSEVLKDLSDDKSTFYKAILQNLFFATLNMPMDDAKLPRRFRGKAKRERGYDQHAGISNVYRYEDYFKGRSAAALPLFASIPFLNGGLFECLDKDDKKEGKRWKQARLNGLVDGFSELKENPLNVPNKIFFCDEHDTLDDGIDLNETFGTKNKHFKVRGLIDTLDRYKFTIAENTPIEEEVALDPELLGKVFENLLASYNPETGATARKQTGSFYTPREIVNYMVDESLIASLETQLTSGPIDPKNDELNTRLRQLFTYTNESHKFSDSEVEELIKAIDAVKILDPACGSGAFPMGMLHKLVFILQKLDISGELWRERQRQRAIAETEEAFHIGEQRERDERLREISDIFERNSSDYGRKLFLIENCIYGVDIQPIAIQIAKLRFFISLIIDQKIHAEAKNLGITPLPNLETKLVAANALLALEGGERTLKPEKVSELEKELKEVRGRIFRARTPSTKAKWRTEDKRIRAEIAELLKQAGFPSDSADRIAEWQPDNQDSSADWFDAEWMFGIEGGFGIVIGNPPYVKEATYKNAFDGVRDSPYYQGKMDLWYLFACYGLDLLIPNNGILTFIAINNWITNAGASRFRTKISKEAQILGLVDFANFMVFESSAVQTMVMIFRRNPGLTKYSFDYRKLVAAVCGIDDVVNLLAREETQKAEYLYPQFERSKLQGKTFDFTNDSESGVLDKIYAKGRFFIDGNKEIMSGIDVLQDSVNKQSQKRLGNKFKIGEGIFVLSSDEKRKLGLTDKERELLKPFYTTKELQRYYGDRKNEYWVIYTNSSFKNPATIRAYPHIKAHLDRFREVITSDNGPYGLHRARDEFFFTAEKITSVRKCANPTFTYVDFDCYVSRAFISIRTDRLSQKYLTGILNSRTIAFWLRKKGKLQGLQYQIDNEPITSIPIAVPTEEQSAAVERIVDSILEMKRSDRAANTSKAESQIEELVYDLYDLTSEERAVIEDSAQR